MTCDVSPVAMFLVDMQVFHVIDNNQLLLLRIGTDGRILERYDHVLMHSCHGCLLKLCNFETNFSGGCHTLTWEAWLQSQNGFLRFPECFDNSLIKPPKSIFIDSLIFNILCCLINAATLLSQAGKEAGERAKGRSANLHCVE